MAYIVQNHIVRFCAGGAINGGPVTLSNLGARSLPDALLSLNDFRSASGITLSKAAYMCPDRTTRYCSGALYGVRTVLGLQ